MPLFIFLKGGEQTMTLEQFLNLQKRNIEPLTQTVVMLNGRRLVYTSSGHDRGSGGKKKNPNPRPATGK